jgi:dTDP-4-amino-4,6-dideoxygalactose transaminase
VFCGEGGALVLNDPALVERAEIVREKGTDRTRFFRGEIDRYTWRDLGSSYLPGELLAAFLFAQLEARSTIQERRRRLWERYEEGLADWAEARGVRLPAVPAHCTQPYHNFYLLLSCFDERQAFMAHLRGRGIHAPFHYLPLHLSEMGVRLGGRPGDCPVTESVCDRLVRLPFFTTLGDDRQDRVIAAVRAF